MHRLAQTCALLVTVGWATVSLAAAVPELICDPTIQNRCAPVSKLLDGGYGFQVTCDNCGSTGSGPGGGLTNSELRATPVPVGFDGGAATSYQGGTWTVAANAGTNLNTSALATQAGQTDGTAKAIARGGAKGATAAADITGTAEGADHQAIDAQLYSGGTAYKGLVSGDAVDVNDRAARLLGKADVLVGAAAPSATNPLFVRLTDGTTAYVGFKSGDVIGALPAGGALIGAVKFSQSTTDNDVDVTSLPALPTGSNVIGALTANQSVNVALINGVAPLMGNGTTGTGSPRVTIVSDNSAVAGFGVGATGAAVPANASYQGVREGANLVGQIQCDKTAKADIASAANTQLVALSGSTVIYVCSYAIEIQGVVTTAGTLNLNYGTGTACATGTVVVTPTFVGSTTAGNPFSLQQQAGAGYLFKTTAGQALCATSTTTTPQKVFVTYGQF